MTVLLDTHVLIWILLGSRRLRELGDLEALRPWGVSPVSLLEIQFLAETGKAKVRNPQFTETLLGDGRFLVDEVPLVTLMKQAVQADWTRDPFDRMLVGHSLARRIPICTADWRLREHHSLIWEG